VGAQRRAKALRRRAPRAQKVSRRFHNINTYVLGTGHIRDSKGRGILDIRVRTRSKIKRAQAIRVRARSEINKALEKISVYLKRIG